MEHAAHLPPPDVYEAEYQFWPWGRLIERAIRIVVEEAPLDGVVLDYMCGTGYLLSRVKAQRPDLQVIGCDNHGPFVSYSAKKYPEIVVHHADALTFIPSEKLDVLVCTAGLHHLNDGDQVKFIQKMAREISPQSLVLIGEVVLGEYSNQLQRRIAALRLGSEVLEYALITNWPEQQIETALEVLSNDIIPRGEYKRSCSEWKYIMCGSLSIISSESTWNAANSGGGDMIFRCTLAIN